MIFNIITILGFLLACISLGWQFWTFHKTHSERIKGTLYITTVPISSGKNVPALKLEIWNDGTVPVYVRSVSLCWGDEGYNLGDTVTELLFQSRFTVSDPLQPGNGRTYILPAIAPQMFSKANEQPKEKVWVSVRSHKKEVLRIKDENLKAYLDEIVKSTSSQNNDKLKS